MKNCILCGCNKFSKTLEDRVDHEYNILTRLNYYKCKNIFCGFVFVDPLPSNEQIKTFYSNYSTHSENKVLSNINI